MLLQKRRAAHVPMRRSFIFCNLLTARCGPFTPALAAALLPIENGQTRFACMQLPLVDSRLSDGRHLLSLHSEYSDMSEDCGLEPFPSSLSPDTRRISGDACMPRARLRSGFVSIPGSGAVAVSSSAIGFVAWKAFVGRHSYWDASLFRVERASIC